MTHNFQELNVANFYFVCQKPYDKSEKSILSKSCWVKRRASANVGDCALCVVYSSVEQLTFHSNNIQSHTFIDNFIVAVLRFCRFYENRAIRKVWSSRECIRSNSENGQIKTNCVNCLYGIFGLQWSCWQALLEWRMLHFPYSMSSMNYSIKNLLHLQKYTKTLNHSHASELSFSYSVFIWTLYSAHEKIITMEGYEQFTFSCF